MTSATAARVLPALKAFVLHIPVLTETPHHQISSKPTVF